MQDQALIIRPTIDEEEFYTLMVERLKSFGSSSCSGHPDMLLLSDLTDVPLLVRLSPKGGSSLALLAEAPRLSHNDAINHQTFLRLCAAPPDAWEVWEVSPGRPPRLLKARIA